ncbi:MAG: glucuronate isomerase [Cyclobacteriaceae bacterium]|nr:glucuronate isomerase [Cyclobacteriaceae bacterium]
MSETIANTSFLTEDFLLQNKFAKILYHDYAKDLPIIDYHCHLPQRDIAINRQFENLSQIWLAGDHYKWRAMRTLGINEKYITGNATDKDKFEKWAYTVPYTVRNPLYHWTHLELKRYFDINQLLNPDGTDTIYTTCTEKLNTPEYSTRSLLTKMNVQVVCTTDDPADSLEDHIQLKQENFGIKILPTFRPDKAYAVENPATYVTYLSQLSSAASVEINRYPDLLKALEKRIEFFVSAGCKLADHGLEQLYHFNEDTFDIEVIFKKLKKLETLTIDEVRFFKYKTLLELCRLYHKQGWTQQFHLGALRNTNERMLRELGPDTGFDSIGDFSQSVALSKFLNELDSTNQLAKTILYNLNPSDNEVMGTMIGNFNDGSSKGKIQFGSAWWFLDQKDGMEKQINALSNLGLLSCFIGMLTDSRSFLSYPRHEYFRRILCNLIGRDVENGELPKDEKWLGKIVSDICHYNAKEYFNF